MSFRSFILYCALCGGWAAFLSWAVGRSAESSGIKGLLLGLFVALALALVDALWNFTMRQAGRAVPQVLAGAVIGAVGGLLGGTIGQFLFRQSGGAAFLEAASLMFGWTITGFLVGASVGAYELMNRFVREQALGGSVQKIIKGALGGTVGGLLGGILPALLLIIFGDSGGLWSPSATGFVVLGLCIGLMIGLAQVIFRQAWLRVEAGFRAGRELILAKPEITIGRAESCDIGLFGDSSVDRLHARIIKENGRYLLVDADSKGGTFVNDEPVEEPTPLRTGDVIQLGNSVLSFKEKEKRGE